MQINMDIPDQDITDTLVSGVEGGIRYWCRSIKRGDPNLGLYDVLLGQTWVLTTDEGERHTLDAAKLRAGIARMRAANPYQFGLMLAGGGDATTGDVLIQYAALGEEVYG